MTILSPRSSFRFAAIVLLLTFLGGCATATNPTDPLESFNRGVYQFNETLDRYVVKPVAQGYQFVLPQPVRTGVSNFFSNMNDITVMVNNLLQGKFLPALDDFSRIVINTSIGLLGLIDVASDAGIQKNNEDFGQTLGVWGLAEGPFIMLPLFGPSTGRDAVGLVGDFYTDVLRSTDPVHLRNQARILRLVNRRAELLDASKVLDAAALDPYEFLRDAYLQRRRNLTYDGRPPLDKDLDLAPPRDKKGDAGSADRTAAANFGLERPVSAAKDPVPQAPVQAPELTPLFSEASGKVISPAPPLFAEDDAVETAATGADRARQVMAAASKAPAPSAEQGASGGSTLMRVWRYIEPREVPQSTLDGL